ncbi:hypothetical protein HYU95_04175 [Candidatus Daviesbacteria bacterium]|nr:hypothetical protein [Candidatus Daviesbacteria bacterium]
MSKIVFKIVLALLLWAFFAFVVLTVTYPESFTQAKVDQLALFFIPLFLALTLSFNVIFKNIFQSSSVSLGLIFLLILKALDSLNLVTGLLILVSVGLLCSYFKKTKRKVEGIKNIRRIR